MPADLMFWIGVVEVPVVAALAGWCYALGRRLEKVKDDYVRRDDWHRELETLRGDVREVGKKIDGLKDWLRPAAVPGLGGGG